MKHRLSCGSQTEEGTVSCSIFGARQTVRSEGGVMNQAAVVLGTLGIILGLSVPILGLVLGPVGVALSFKGGVSHINVGFLLSALAISVSLLSWILGAALLMDLYS